MGEQPKVFEYAKEIGMETLTLMDKIREWKLPVKSHMAALSEDVITEIQTRLDAELSTGKKRKRQRQKKRRPQKRRYLRKKRWRRKNTTAQKKKKSIAKKSATKENDDPNTGLPEDSDPKNGHSSESWSGNGDFPVNNGYDSCFHSRRGYHFP